MNLEIKAWTWISIILLVLGIGVFVKVNQEKREISARETRLFWEEAEKRERADRVEREALIKQRLATTEETANQIRK